MLNEESIYRSEILSDMSKSFFEYKNRFLNKKYKQNQKIIKYFHVSYEDWNNWEWQMKNKIENVEQLKDIFDLSQNEYKTIEIVSKKYRFAITPYYLSLIQKFNTDDPIYKQCIPQCDELNDIGKVDPMNEVNNNPAGAITRRYPDRVIVNITNTCATFCRHCQRRRNIGTVDKRIDNLCLEESYKYIKNHPEIRDVLITGGDPLTLPDEYIDSVLSKIRSIKSVEIIRIGTRTLVTMPQRITDKLVDIIKKYEPIYINTQFNHPIEITKDSSKACLTLANNGILLGNQMVFLKNVNTNHYTIQLLNQLLLTIKVKPYYIFHPKDVVGTKHFSISIKDGINIYTKLRGNTSGLAIPTYILNTENGYGKIPLSKEILELADSDGNITLETWEGNKINVNIRSI